MPGIRFAAVSLLLVLIALVATPGASHADAQSFDDVCAPLQRRAAEIEVQIGFVLVDLRDGRECSANGSETFRSASLYKLIVLVEAYEQSALGEFSFEEPIALQPRHYSDDPSQPRPDGPVELSAREAIRRMVVFSDNASALALRERLGPGRVASAPARLGLAGTSLGEQFVTTPADIARLLSGLYRGDVVSPEASEEMLRLLRGQELNDLIPAALPAETEVAHKTGLIERYLHDAGIIYAPGGDYVLVLLTRWRDSIDESYRAIHELTALAYRAFETPPPPPALVEPELLETAPVAPAPVEPELLETAPVAPAPVAGSIRERGYSGLGAGRPERFARRLVARATARAGGARRAGRGCAGTAGGAHGAATGRDPALNGRAALSLRPAPASRSVPAGRVREARPAPPLTGRPASPPQPRAPVRPAAPRAVRAPPA